MTDERAHEFTRGLYGSITHTDLSSTAPEATRDWCVKVLGWWFLPPLPRSEGDYHLFASSESGGGGIRQTAPGEAPGSTPTVHVANTDAAYDDALAAGAESVRRPETVTKGVRIAMVRAPAGS